MTFVVIGTDRVSENGLTALREDERFDLRLIEDSSSEEFEEALPEAHGLIVRSATKVDAPMIDRGKALRVIGRAGVGVDNIDLVAASGRGIAVFNAPGGNTIAAAELTMALMLSVVRRVTAADRSVRAGEWDRSRFRGVELNGRTLGIIGAGRIGSEVTLRAEAFGMNVILFDPYIPKERAGELGAHAVDFHELLDTSDIVSLHVPLTEETRNLIDAAALKRMNGKSFLINASRGGVIVEEDLAEALNNDVIAGAALDVYESEPLSDDSPLRSAKNLVLTPHLGASTKEAQVGVAREVALSIRRALIDADVSDALNVGLVSGQ